MARLHSPYPLTGSLDGLVFYQRKDSKVPNQTFVRSQGDPLAGSRQGAAAGEGRRRNASEMKGRAALAKDLRQVLRPLEPVRTSNWQSGLSGALRAVQLRDTTGSWGERAVPLSRHGALLAGFALNKRTPLEALVRSPLDYDLDRVAGTATLHLPELVAGANWGVPGAPAWFRWVAVLGAVADQHFVAGSGYTAAGASTYPQTYYGDWYPVKGGAPATTVHLVLPTPPTNDTSLVLAAGIVLGAVNAAGDVVPLGYAGAGKIVAVG